MACFVACKNGEESSLPSLRSILATKQQGLPPLKAKNIKETTFCFVSPNVLRARYRLLRSVTLNFARARPRALPSSTLRPPTENENRAVAGPVNHEDDRDDDDERYGCFLRFPSRQNSARFVVPVSHSGPIPSSSNELSSPPLLFPLPLPPGHISSTSSPAAASSTSSARFQSPDGQPISGPLPLPCPANDVAAALREFSLNELAAGCENFSNLRKLRDGAAGPVYKAMLKLHSYDANDTEATVARATLLFSRKKWKARVQSLARLAHPNLCKIIGFCYEEANSLQTQQNRKPQVQGNVFLLFESTANGSLDSLIRGEDQPPLDWSSRMKIAVGAAEGLAFLHDRDMKQVLHRDFQTSSVQVDANFNAKLCEYGLADDATYSGEALMKSGPANGETPEKRHVRAFGWLLVDLFFAGSTSPNSFGQGKPLNLAVDTCLKGSFSTETAKMVGDLATGCLVADPVLCPSMRHVAHMLHAIETPLGPLSIQNKTYRKKRSLSIG